MTIEMPKVRIGTLNDGTPIDWSYTSSLDCRFLVLTDMPKQKQAMKRLLEQQTSENTTLFTVQPQTINTEEKTSLIDLLEFEGVAPAKVEDEHVSRFKEQRLFLVTQYVRVLSEWAKIDKESFFKESSYRPHVEGPLNTFIRNVELLTDEKERILMKEEFDNLTSVDWYKVKELEQLTFSYESTDKISMMLKFIKSIWTFWATIQAMEEQKNIILVIDIEDDWFQALKKQDQEVVMDLFKVLLDITYDFTVSCVVLTDSIYLSSQLPFRYKLFGKGRYISQIEEVDREPFLTKELMNEWETNTESFHSLLYDEGTNTRYIGAMLLPLELEIV